MVKTNYLLLSLCLLSMSLSQCKTCKIAGIRKSHERHRFLFFIFYIVVLKIRWLFAIICFLILCCYVIFCSVVTYCTYHWHNKKFQITFKLFKLFKSQSYPCINLIQTHRNLYHV